MLLVWGTRLYGKVDEVPGLFRVETRFWHGWYFPLIPVGSFVVVQTPGGQAQGVPIPLSGKSILFAWLRAGFVVSAAVGLIGGLAPTLHGGSVETMRLAAGVLAMVAWAVATHSRFAKRADLVRARELGRRVGLSAEGWRRLDQVFGHDPVLRANETTQPAHFEIPHERFAPES